MDLNNYLCPCGKRLAFYVTKKPGKNHGRAYVKCLDEICGLYSFVDELKMCPCNQGYCRTMFKSSNKYWVCAMQGNRGACRFKELIVTLPGTSTTPLITTPRHIHRPTYHYPPPPGPHPQPLPRMN